MIVLMKMEFSDELMAKEGITRAQVLEMAEQTKNEMLRETNEGITLSVEVLE